MSRNGLNNRGGRPKLTDGGSINIAIPISCYKILRMAAKIEGKTIKNLADIAIQQYLEEKSYYQIIKNLNEDK